MVEKNTNNFGQRLKEERERMGLTQVELAKKLGVSFKTISNYEAGGHKAPLLKMVQAGIDINYLITGVRMSPECLAELRKGLENGSDWKPSPEFIVGMVKQYLELL
jgi:transcriptional regulator with XRE-family HTH domain